MSDTWLSDDAFVRAFETCELPVEQFHHRDHLRLAWIYLHRYGRTDAGAYIAESIQRFAAHLGKPNLYHETITQAWLHLTAYAAGLAGGGGFEDALAAYPSLLEKELLGKFYSPALLASAEARRDFAPPDIGPLPVLPRQRSI